MDGCPICAGPEAEHDWSALTRAHLDEAHPEIVRAAGGTPTPRVSPERRSSLAGDGRGPSLPTTRTPSR